MSLTIADFDPVLGSAYSAVKLCSLRRCGGPAAENCRRSTRSNYIVGCNRGHSSSTANLKYASFQPCQTIATAAAQPVPNGCNYLLRIACCDFNSMLQMLASTHCKLLACLLLLVRLLSRPLAGNCGDGLLSYCARAEVWGDRRQDSCTVDAPRRQDPVRNVALAHNTPSVPTSCFSIGAVGTSFPFLCDHPRADKSSWSC